LENAMITLKNITVFRDRQLVINQVTEQIPAGQITVIIGPNGSGKSTLLAAIAGDLPLHDGHITIDNEDVRRLTAAELSGLRSMCLQNQSFTLGFTVRQIIEMAGPATGVLEQLDLSDLAERAVTTLSGGQSQRVAIAQAIARNAPVLLLDEPLAAQDIHSCDRIIALLKKLAASGTTVVVVAHADHGQLSWADKIIEQQF
jgi:iron complex transport system ATP-binding protein